MSNVYDAFRKLGIDAPLRSVGQVKVTCPKCRDSKPGTRDKDLSINYDTGAYLCHSAKCGWKGYAKPDEPKYSRPEWKNRTDLPSNIVRWFESRGISQMTLQKMKVTSDERGGIEFNYFKGSELVNIKTRFEIEGKKAFKQHAGAEKLLYNFNSLEGKDKCIFVEGEMDVLSWVEAGVSNEYSIVSVDGGAPAPGQKSDGKLECITNAAEELDKVKDFYLCLDKDAPGEYLQEELIRRFGAHRCWIVTLPKGKKDANEVLDRRNGNLQSADVCRETLRMNLKDAKPVPLSGIYTLDDDLRDKMIRYYHEGRQHGTTTHFMELDDLFTFLPGEMTLMTGLPGDGKSQFVRQLALLKARYNDWKWACYVPEDFPVDSFYEDLCHCLVGKPTEKRFYGRMSFDEFIEAMDFVREHFFCIFPEPDKETGEVPLPDNRWINQRINFLKLKYGVNAYVKDPWNKIAHNFQSREDLYLAQELSREKFFAVNFDAAFYVAHPSKLQKEKDGRYPCPTPYDVAGGAMWNNMMDNCITVYRPERWSDGMAKSVEVHTFKIKKQKLVGRLGSVMFNYEPMKNRYYLNEYNAFDREPKLILNGHEKDTTEIPFAQVANNLPGFGDNDDIPF